MHAPARRRWGAASLVAVCAVMIASAAAGQVPALVKFDPAGGGSYSVVGINEFDWQSSGDLVIENALPQPALANGVPVTTLAAFFASAVVGNQVTYRAHIHARLNDMLDSGGASIRPGTLSRDGATCTAGTGCFEVTAATSFTETAVLVATTPIKLIQFLSIEGSYTFFLDSTPDSSVATGTGFVDGLPFLQGDFTAVSGTFGLNGSSITAGAVTNYLPAVIEVSSPAGFSLAGNTFDSLISAVSAGESAVAVGGTAGLMPYTVKSGDLVYKADANSEFFADAEPCIDLEKQVWDGQMWQDADTEAEAVMLTDGALYRLVVTNCGLVPLTNVMIDDPDLGIIDYLVGDLAPGQEVVITEILVGGVNLLADPDICESGPGPYLNTACAEGTYGEIVVEDCDPAWVECPPEFACRVTAGGNKDGVYCPLIEVRKNVFEPDPAYCNVEEFTNDISHTWGGQAGAPPRVDGNWTHKYDNNSVKPADHFTFHSNDVRWIQCSDPGEFCSPARFAPNRQIDFSGYGVFTNGRGQFNALAGKTEYCFMVHLEDIGEPGPGGRWPSATEPCTHCPGTEVVEPDCVNCTDYYSIEIYAGALNEATGACSGTLIWRNGRPSDNCGAMEDWVAPYAPYEGYFIRAGNVQMHPDNNGP